MTSTMTVPRRFRSAERRGRAIGRPLVRFAGVDAAPDEALMDRLGRALLERDELAAAVASDMRHAPGDPRRLTHADIAAALERAPARSADEPESLRALLDEAYTVPDWVDLERIERGAATFRYLGTTANDVLLLLSLIGGYRFGGPADLLVMTGALSGDGARRRLAETQKWGHAVTRAGGLLPSAEGWRLTVHVRLMHALVNEHLTDRWDVAQWGLPINQADQAGTLGLFDATLILGCRALGIPLTSRQRADLMHLWRYVGHLIGVDPDFLTDDETERHRINYHVLVAAPDQTEAGRRLAHATLDAAAGGSALVRERSLSMLTALIGLSGMRDLGLPARPPWGIAQTFALNTAVYRTGRLLPGGRRLLERRGALGQDALLARSFGDGSAGVGALPH